MGAGGMTVLVAHLHTLKTWLFLSSRHRLVLFLFSIPILWLFWGFCCPALVVGRIDVKNTLLSLFTAWYLLSYLQDLTGSESAWGLSVQFYLPACPALPISPLKRLGAEFLFLFIIAGLVFVPFLGLHLAGVIPSIPPNATAVRFFLNALQGTLAIAPIVFSMRMNVHSAFMLPATLRLALPILFCCLFVVFQITGLHATLTATIILFALQTLALCLLFVRFRGSNSKTFKLPWIKHFSSHFLDHALLDFLLGSLPRRAPKPPKVQGIADLAKFMFIYLAYWVCFYFPVIGLLYYIFISYFEKPAIHWFFFFLLFILPVQDSHSFKSRFLSPMSILPLKKEMVMRTFYLLFTLAVFLIWTFAAMLVTLFSSSINLLRLLPTMLLFAPAMAGIWINRSANKPLLVYVGMAMLCALPVGIYLNMTHENRIPLYLSALIGALLPCRSLLPPISSFQIQVVKK